jgi:hypothetical protein
MMFTLSHAEARRRASDAVIHAPDGYQVRITEPRRNLDQNAKFHAICEDLERAGAKWAESARTAEQWKVLLVSGHAIATKQGAEVVTGIEGELVNIRESTALMSKSRASSLIEYAQAFAAMHCEAA